MANHSSVLAWKIPWTEEPGGMQSMGSQSQTRLSNTHFMHHFKFLFPVYYKILLEIESESGL